jgi:hypothetical protein
LRHPVDIGLMFDGAITREWLKYTIDIETAQLLRSRRLMTLRH